MPLQQEKAASTVLAVRLGSQKAFGETVLVTYSIEQFVGKVKLHFTPIFPDHVATKDLINYACFMSVASPTIDFVSATSEAELLKIVNRKLVSGLWQPLGGVITWVVPGDGKKEPDVRFFAMTLSSV